MPADVEISFFMYQSSDVFSHSRSNIGTISQCTGYIKSGAVYKNRSIRTLYHSTKEYQTFSRFHHFKGGPFQNQKQMRKISSHFHKFARMAGDLREDKAHEKNTLTHSVQWQRWALLCSITPCLMDNLC